MPRRFCDFVTPEVEILVGARTEELAREESVRQANSFGSSLKRFVEDGTLSTSVYDAMASVTSREAYAAYIIKRRQGQANDKQSIGLGFTALLRRLQSHEIDVIRDKLNIPDQPDFFTPTLVELDQVLQGEDQIGVHALHVPQGIFKYTRDGQYGEMKIDREAVLFDGTPASRRHYPDLNIPEFRVAKIVGNSGELWIHAATAALPLVDVVPAEQ